MKKKIIFCAGCNYDCNLTNLLNYINLIDPFEACSLFSTSGTTSIRNISFIIADADFHPVTNKMGV